MHNGGIFSALTLLLKQMINSLVLLVLIVIPLLWAQNMSRSLSEAA